uniref:Uncharacterized protein n=1 Tax=Sphaerodactylus townsendi TaxID=933632 RepID=A0ACB8FV17_9SAUR
MSQHPTDVEDSFSTLPVGRSGRKRKAGGEEEMLLSCILLYCGDPPKEMTFVGFPNRPWSTSPDCFRSRKWYKGNLAVILQAHHICNLNWELCAWGGESQIHMTDTQDEDPEPDLCKAQVSLR